MPRLNAIRGSVDAPARSQHTHPLTNPQLINSTNLSNNMSPNSPVTPTSPILITPTRPSNRSFPPVITITPATLSSFIIPSHSPTFPTKPIAPSTTTSSKPIQTPPTSTFDPTIDSATCSDHSLYSPLKRHLALLHPSTPSPIISYITHHLLSRSAPHGHTGSWTPLWALDGDLNLSTAGLGMEAGRGVRQRDGGKGKEVDMLVEEMYGVARRSWGLMQEGGKVEGLRED